jgi:hypothetical protein
VSVLAVAWSPNVSRAARRPGAEAQVQGGEVRFNPAIRRRRRLGVRASGHLGHCLGPSPWRPPLCSAPPGCLGYLPASLSFFSP